MGSFYGGQPGKNFEIKKLFLNKKALVNDLNDSNSEVLIGDFVCINYGVYGSEGFRSNQNIDTRNYGQSYDSTFWQKIIMNEKYNNFTKAVTGNREVNYILINTGNGYIPNYSVGSVITTTPGTSAAVDLNQEDQELQFSFSIPKGDTGEPLRVIENIQISLSTYNESAVNEAIAAAMANKNLNPGEIIAFTFKITNTNGIKNYWVYKQGNGTQSKIPIGDSAGFALATEKVTTSLDATAYSAGFLNNNVPFLENGKVKADNLPNLNFIPTTDKGKANGVASLNSSGKVPTTQLPDLDFIPTGDKGVANGVASLNSSGKVPTTQLPEISSVHLFTGTLTVTGWVTQDDGSSQQILYISGVTADMNGTVDHDTAKAAAANYDLYVQEETEYLDKITNGYSETVAGGIKFVIFGDKPTIDIPIVAQLA